MLFESYAAAGFATELLPILPPDAAISPRSPQRDNLLASRGKVPGKLSAEGWFGFVDWSTHETVAEDYHKWSKWKAGTGLQGRRYPGLDIDVDDVGLADAIEADALFALGLAPARSGRAGRRLLVYSCQGLRKRRLVFRVGGGLAEPAGGLVRGPEELQDGGRDLADVGQGAAEGGPVYAVELLGAGQQYIVEGIHPKTMAPYAWRDGRSPAVVGAAGLTVLTPAQVDAFFEGLEEMLVTRFGCEILRREAAGTGGQGTWQEGLTAPSLDAVREALAAIPNEMDYDDWLKLMAATKAATEGLEA